MSVQTEEPTVEDVAEPVAKLWLSHPVSPLGLTIVGATRIEIKDVGVPSDLCVECKLLAQSKL